jgi:hypothetical protein
MFLIGAGCSASAGIPLAAEVAQAAIVGMAEVYNILDPVDFTGLDRTARAQRALDALEALIKAEKIPPRYWAADGAHAWGDLYSYIFSEHIKHPNDQRALITKLVDTESFDLNWAHACLGELVHQRIVHTVLTTNFDQLVLKGIIRTGIVPVVADGLESLSRISPKPHWPQVVHLHGSMHTYELRNSREALRETEDDRGLQTMMLSILRETTVLVVVGYSGGEEGIMSLLHEAAAALPRMVVYWIAYERDYALLSPRARAFLEIGEHKYFVLGQESDEFFNKLIGELGIGPPGWIKRPLEVLSEQVTIRHNPGVSDDVNRLIRAYEARVAHAVDKGRLTDTPEIDATELRSANKFREAVERIASDPAYASRPEALRIHATSLFDDYNRSAAPREADMREVIGQFEVLVAGPNARMSDAEFLIEAQRDLYETLPRDHPDLPRIAQAIADGAQAAQAKAELHSRAWAVMEFYRAEAGQLVVEQLRRPAPGTEPPKKRDRARERELQTRLGLARQAYSEALPYLVRTDTERARECKEGLAGALSLIAELETNKGKALSYLREARTLFQEVVDVARRNTPGAEYAGALANLAGVVEVTAKRFPEEAHNARGEERRLLQTARAIYLELDDPENAERMQRRLDRHVAP